MALEFTGTATLGETTYDATAVMNRTGGKFVGTIYINDLNHSFPLTAVSIGDTFYTRRTITFVAPDSAVVTLGVISEGSTSISENDLGFEFSGSCIISGDEAEFEFSFERTIPRVDTISYTQQDIRSTQTSSKKKLRAVRINEVGNPLDHFGDLLSLPRTYKEPNNLYRDRVATVMTARPGSTYAGLINGISSSLALSKRPVISVSAKNPASEAVVRLVVSGNLITIYSNWVGEEDQRAGLRPTISRQAILGKTPVNTVGTLADWINASDEFSSSVIADGDLSSEFITEFDSRGLVSESIAPQEQTKLLYDRIVRGSFVIKNGLSVFTERGEPTEVERPGDFYLDYDKGLLTMLTDLDKKINVTYLTSLPSFSLELADVKILDLSKRSVQETLFNQVEQQFYSTLSEKTVNGLPTDTLYGIIRKLLTASKYNQYWGE